MLLAKPLILVVALAGIYLLVVRPIRGVIVRDMIYPEALAAASHKAGTKLIDYSPQRIDVEVKLGQATPRHFNYGVAFGAYYIIPIIFFVIIDADRGWTIFTTLFHCVFFLVETGFLFMGLLGSQVFLQGMDLLSYFLLPASFGIVALAWFETREKRKANSSVGQNPAFGESDRQAKPGP